MSVKHKRRAFEDDDAAYIRGWWYALFSISELAELCHVDRSVISDIVYREGAYK